MINDSIVAQLAEVTATSEDGEHLLLLEPGASIILPDMEGRIATAIAAISYLHVGDWDASHPCAVDRDCVLWSHVSDLPATVAPPTEEEVDALVRKASRPSLASLYKNARGKGLVAPQPQGYF